MTQKVNPTVLANTAVTAGIYGGSTRIPFFTVDDQGRLTNAGNTNPSVANTQITGVITATQVANTANYAINISGTAGAAGVASAVPVGGITGTQYSYTNTTRPGPTRLYRDDDNSAFNIRTFYNSSTNLWSLQGYNGDSLHNGVEVSYANTAGSALASDVYSWAKTANKPTYTKSEIGLGNVDNTADANKSVSSANSASYATTQSPGDNSTKIATTAYVDTQITTSAIGWNVTYTSVNISSGGSWTIPTNCIGVYVYCYVSGVGNNGGNGRAQIKNSGGSTIGTVYVNGTNAGVLSGRADGGSGMTDAAAAFIPISSSGASIYFDVVDNGVSGTFYIQAYVTK